MKKYICLILFVSLSFMLCMGCTGSDNQQNTSQIASAPDKSENTQSTGNQDAEWASEVYKNGLLFKDDINKITSAIENNDVTTSSKAAEAYKEDLMNKIKDVDNFTVSPELKQCKEEYRLGLLNDYNSATFVKSGLDQLASGNLESFYTAMDFGANELVYANDHFENATLLLKSYNIAHPDTQLNITFSHHNVSSEENQTRETIASVEETSTSTTKTLADKEPESDEPHASEDSDDVEDSSTSNIFDYCTWQAEIIKTIGKYYEAPEGNNYVVVTVKIDNTGDQTYSTNPGYWHLKIGDMYYQSNSATYDNSLNHMTADVGPGGKITTKIAYLVDGEPSISDMDMYYDGPGSSGTITF